MQAGFKLLDPFAEVLDAFDAITGLDQPVDVLVEPGSVVVRVHHVVSLIGPCGGTNRPPAQGGDCLGDEFDWEAVEVRALPVALAV
jgi:hypothetical protein